MSEIDVEERLEEIEELQEHEPIENAKQPFTSAKLTMIVGEQGSGKSTILAAKAVDATYKGLTRIRVFLPDRGDGQEHYYDVKASPALNEEGKPIIGYATIYLPNKEPFIAQVPVNAYAIADGVRIFYNGHYYGIRYMHVETADIIQYINTALFMDGIINYDEGYIGASNRSSMSSLGQTITDSMNQIRKRRIHFNIASPQDGQLDRRFRLTRTERIICSYDEVKGEVTAKIQKAKKREKIISFDATLYRPYFNTNERYKLLESKVSKAYQEAM
jgi:hypothetical protein